MYLRSRCRKKGGIQHESWALVESVWTARGPRQRAVVTVGKLPGLDAEEKIGWEEISRVLDGKPATTASLFEQEPYIPSWATVKLKGVQVERLRHFGDVYLGLALWERQGLEEFCEEHIPSGREDIPWSVMAVVLSLTRFCTFVGTADSRFVVLKDRAVFMGLLSTSRLMSVRPMEPPTEARGHRQFRSR